MRVTAQHIADGEIDTHGRGDVCPIALAVSEEFPNSIDIEVGHTTILIRDLADDCIGTVDRAYHTPDVACYFIVDFDAGRAVEPIEFDLVAV